MTTRILVVETKTIGEKPLTYMTEYIPGEEGIAIDYKREATRKGLDWGHGSGDLTVTLGMVNPFIAHYQSTSPMGSAEVARHLGVLPEPMDYLQCQWENAEVPTEDSPIRKGDILIRKDHDTAYEVWACETKGRSWEDDARILRRAPKLEPWRDLADVLGTNSGELIGEHHSITEVAKALHERGVRVVTGGDER